MDHGKFSSRRYSRRQILKRGAGLAGGFGLATALSSLLSACGQTAQTPAAPEAAADPTAAPAAASGSGSLSLLLGSHMEPVMQIVEMYESTYGVTPQVEQITTPDLQNKVTSAMLARTSPGDAIFVTAALSSSIASRDWLRPMGEFINTNVRNGGHGTLMERGMGAANYQGEYYGVPWTMGAPILHWNKQMFSDADLDPEAPATWHSTPNSWDTMVEYARQLTGTRNGEQVYGLTDAWAGTAVLLTWGALLQMHGGRFLDDDLQPVMNSEAGIAATEKLYDLLHTHQVIDPAVTTYTWVFDASPGYLNGTRGMFFTWPFIAGLANNSEDSAIAGQSGFAPNPAVDTSASVDGSEFFSIPVFAENEEEAMRFIELVTSREGQRIVAQGGWASIYSDVLEEPEILEQFPFYEAIRQSYEYPVDGGWSPDRTTWAEILSTEIAEVLAQRKQPKEALDDAVREINASRA